MDEEAIRRLVREEMQINQNDGQSRQQEQSTLYSSTQRLIRNASISAVSESRRSLPPSTNLSPTTSSSFSNTVNNNNSPQTSVVSTSNNAVGYSTMPLRTRPSMQGKPYRLKPYKKCRWNQR